MTTEFEQTADPKAELQQKLAANLEQQRHLEQQLQKALEDVPALKQKLEENHKARRAILREFSKAK
jgi:chaperonin cofactor prefoldin